MLLLFSCDLKSGQYAVAELLLERGASVYGKQGARMTGAIRNSEESMVKILDRSGCEVNGTYPEGKTIGSDRR